MKPRGRELDQEWARVEERRDRARETMSRFQRAVRLAGILAPELGLAFDDALECANNALVAADAPRTDDDPRPLGLEGALHAALAYRRATRPQAYASLAARDLGDIARTAVERLEAA